MSLTPNCIQQIHQGADIGNLHPTVQVIDVKEIASSNGPKRYRLVISDGQHYQQAMLATQLNPLVESGEVSTNCVIQIQDGICNLVASRRIVILLQVSLVSKADAVGNVQIGNPTNVDATGDTGAQPGAPQQAAPSAPSSSFSSAKASAAASAASMNAAPSHASDLYMPISGLNPYSSGKWTIKARVTKKGNIREWKNARGSGKLFSIDLLDKDGTEIRATMFQAACDKFFPLLQENCVYVISGGQVKMANRRFSTVDNEYELTLNENAEIQLVDDVGEIDTIQYNLVPISSLTDVPANTLVDVVGVVTACQPTQNITSKKGNELVKRAVTLIDDSGTSVELTLWNDMALKFSEADFEPKPVLAIKGARTSDFNGVSLGSGFDAQVTLQPDIPEAHRLRAWFDSQGGNVQAKSLSSQGGGSRRPRPRITLGDVAASGLGMNEQADFFSVKATLNYVLHNPDRPPWYQACPKDGCNKKVTAEGGSFFCAGCNMSYPNHEKRYIMRCTVVDHAAKQWMTAFNNAAVSIVGKTADEIAPMLSDPATAKTAFKPALFKQFILFCRAKNEEYNGDTRMKVQIDAAEPLDYATEARHLLSVIEQYA